MASFKRDYKLGMEEEQNILSTLNMFFGTTLHKLDPMAPFDFSDGKIDVELKRRQTDSGVPDTIIPYSKILKITKETYFVFSFNDCVMYIKYDKEHFSKFKVDYFQRWRRSDFNDIAQKYVFIPIKELKVLNVCIKNTIALGPISSARRRCLIVDDE
jgi:hypothetical protein